MSFSLATRWCDAPLMRRVLQFKGFRRKIQSYNNNNMTYTLFRHRWMKRLPVFSSGLKMVSTVTDKDSIDMSKFPVERIRNFCIIAHIDHGKSTLADRLLEMTGAIATTQKNKQVLDKLQVERERGITVKAQTASLIYSHQGQQYLLNLIDTPGHVDFSYEVSRSISACQGVLLIVDANQGVQAQTVANFYLAFEAQLAIVPVINKIDLKNADPVRVESQIEKVFDIPRNECIRISAKLGTNVEAVLQAVVDRIPPPAASIDGPFKALVFDYNFDHYRGVVANIAVFGGRVRKGDRIVSAYLGKSYEVNELGILRPDEHQTQKLFAGQVGYMVAGMKDVKEAQIGDTLYLQGQPVETLPGFKPAKPMVFAGMFPMDQSDYLALRSAIERLTLNDSSVAVQRDSSMALGAGWRLGFLGLLHMEVFNQRLEQEYNASVIVTAPTVPYRAVLSSPRLIKVRAVCSGDRAYSVGKSMCERLQDSIPRQMFEIAVQAAIGNKVIARETIKAYRKNVLAKCYGGDITRKMKLLKKQAEGKKKMRLIGNVEVPKDAFISVLKRNDK
ncbi:translation factor GUF1, mitochondrial [Pseudoliparis swirei]|uniref:translation factor GUF1, mitochondrial n=1 Tax=Pseudoliparis swirei TaxID=2059687 RepID=UPI0024BE1305|nr:translation factor GUF1, mitochondrial [Pseudoliparis swirei]